MNRAATRPTTTAIGKVTAVLESLAEHSRTIDVASATGLPTSTVHRILQELVGLGWVREDGEHGYAIGPRMLSLAGRAPGDRDIVRVARPALQRLNDRTGHAVHLGSQTGDEVVYIDKLEGRRSYHMRSRVGLVVPIHSTGIGKAILAFHDPVDVRALLARTGMPVRTENTITDVDRFLAELATSRRRGYAVDFEENELHTRCVAVAIHDQRGSTVAAISVSALSLDMDEARMKALAPLVIQAAKEITENLGGEVPPVPPIEPTG